MFQPHLQRGYTGSFMRTGNSSFSLVGTRRSTGLLSSGVARASSVGQRLRFDAGAHRFARVKPKTTHMPICLRHSVFASQNTSERGENTTRNALPSRRKPTVSNLTLLSAAIGPGQA